MDELSYIGNADPSAIDYLYKEFKKDPESVDLGWKKFFEGFEFAFASYEESGDVPENFQKEFKVINLINGYRSRGHLFTKTNPVRERRKYLPNLNIENFGLSTDDLGTVFQAGEQVNIGPSSLQEIIDHLELTYCQSIGIEFMYMRRPDRVEWFRNKIEIKNRPVFNKERKLKLYEILVKAHGFESFLGKNLSVKNDFLLKVANLSYLRSMPW
jgi:2-oxoglutarate dehydrogenase E1 component